MCLLPSPKNSPGCSLFCGRFDQCRFQDQVKTTRRRNEDDEGSPVHSNVAYFENSIIERGARTFLPEAPLLLLCASHLLQVATDFQSGALVELVVAEASGSSHNACFVAYNHDFEDDPGQLMADNHVEENNILYFHDWYYSVLLFKISDSDIIMVIMRPSQVK